MPFGTMCFSAVQGADEGADAADYVKRMRQQNKLIMGIGHRIKSLSNPDMRVTIIKDYALKHFKNNKVLDFAMAVEQVQSISGLLTPVNSRTICGNTMTCLFTVRHVCASWLVLSRTRNINGGAVVLRHDVGSGVYRSFSRSTDNTSILAPQVTTKKRETLILNVDGCIAACFVDLLRSCGAFTQEEVNFAMIYPFLLLACVSCCRRPCQHP